MSIISAYGRKCVFDSEAYLEREEHGRRMNKESLNYTAVSCICSRLISLIISSGADLL